MKNTFLALGIAIVLLIGGFFALNAYIYNEKQAGEIDDTKITSYEECVAAGYPSMESYPEQCRTADGKHFVRKLSESELEGIASEITIQGTLVCLPHWDTSGPTTMECAFGLLSVSGNYYVLRDAELTPSPISMVDTESFIEVTGTLIPGSHERYRSIGTIEIYEFAELEAESAE